MLWHKKASYILRYILAVDQSCWWKVEVAGEGENFAILAAQLTFGILFIKLKHSVIKCDWVQILFDCVRNNDQLWILCCNRLLTEFRRFTRAQQEWRKINEINLILTSILTFSINTWSLTVATVAIESHDAVYKSIDAKKESWYHKLGLQNLESENRQL